MYFQHFMPECNLLIGENTLSGVGKITKQWGDNILLVTGRRNMEKLGFLNEVIESIKKEDLRYSLYDKVEPNPTVDIIDQGVEFARKASCNVIVALGGGSSIDTAKAIAVGATHFPESGGTIWDFSNIGNREKRAKEITSKTLPIVAVTSTSGSGSHVTPTSVLTNSKTHEKPGLSSKYMFPKASIVDLRVVSKMSPPLTAVTGIDVLSHATESFLGRGNHPSADLFSLKAVELVAENLPRVYEDGSNMQARSNMALADTLAGWAITLAGTILGHALGHPISGHYNLAHGVTLAVVTPVIWNFLIECSDQKILDKFVYIAQALGEEVSLPGTKEKASLAVDALRRLLRKVGLDNKLSKYGLDKSMIETLAKDALRYMTVDLGRTPVDITLTDLVGILQECM